MNDEKPKYITDRGTEIDATNERLAQDPLLRLFVIPRYGVWAWDSAKGKYQVIDVGRDLEELKTKHGIESDPITMQDFAHEDDA